MYKGIMVLYFCFSFFVFADAGLVGDVHPNIQALVKQVKNAPASQKRILMNQLKVMLRQSNQLQRTHVIQELRQSFSVRPGMHKGQYKRVHKGASAHAGTQQPKHPKGEGRKGGKQGGGHTH